MGGDFPEGLTPLDYIKGEERSVLRNPLLAQTLYLSRDIERWGSGLRRIYEECTAVGVKVNFKTLKTGFLVTFSRAPEDIGVSWRDTAKDTAKDTVKALTERERAILEELRQDPYVTAAKLSAKLGINLRNTKKYIARLKEKGLIRRVGPAKGGHWELVR